MRDLPALMEPISNTGAALPEARTPPFRRKGTSTAPIGMSQRGVLTAAVDSLFQNQTPEAGRFYKAHRGDPRYLFPDEPEPPQNGRETGPLPVPIPVPDLVRRGCGAGKVPDAAATRGQLTGVTFLRP